MSPHPLRVLITGSNRGIGRETARHFAARGAKVALHGRNRDRLEEVCSEFRAAGYDVAAVVGDVSVAEDVDALVHDGVRALGGLDVLVNNAGIAMRGRFEDLSPSVIDQVLRTNVAGAMMTTIAALPHLKASGGSVVFVSSLVGLWGLPLVSVYSASKMALTAIVQNLRTELAGNGVHVGIVYVAMTQHDSGKAILRVDGSPYPLAPRPRADTQEHVARVIYNVVRNRRQNAVLTPTGRVLAFFTRYFPRMFALIMRAAAGKADRLSR